MWGVEDTVLLADSLLSLPLAVHATANTSNPRQLPLAMAMNRGVSLYLLQHLAAGAATLVITRGFVCVSVQQRSEIKQQLDPEPFKVQSHAIPTQDLFAAGTGRCEICMHVQASRQY